MLALFVFLLLVGAGAFLGLGACLIGIALEARRIPNLPLSMRLNPFNILADQSLWTPRVDALHRAGVRFGVLFIGCVVVAVLVRLLSQP
jgi:hypothetical protein